MSSTRARKSTKESRESRISRRAAALEAFVPSPLPEVLLAFLLRIENPSVPPPLWHIVMGYLQGWQGKVSAVECKWPKRLQRDYNNYTVIAPDCLVVRASPSGVQVRSLHTLQIVCRLPVQDTGYDWRDPRCYCVSPNGALLGSCVGERSRMSRWDFNLNVNAPNNFFRCRWSVELGVKNGLTSLALAGRSFAVALIGEKDLKIVEIETGLVTRTMKLQVDTWRLLSVPSSPHVLALPYFRVPARSAFLIDAENPRRRAAKLDHTFQSFRPMNFLVDPGILVSAGLFAVQRDAGGFVQLSGETGQLELFDPIRDVHLQEFVLERFQPTKLECVSADGSRFVTTGEETFAQGAADPKCMVVLWTIWNSSPLRVWQVPEVKRLIVEAAFADADRVVLLTKHLDLNQRRRLQVCVWDCARDDDDEKAPSVIQALEWDCYSCHLLPLGETGKVLCLGLAEGAQHSRTLIIE